MIVDTQKKNRFNWESNRINLTQKKNQFNWKKFDFESNTLILQCNLIRIDLMNHEWFISNNELHESMHNWTLNMIIIIKLIEKVK